MTKYYLLVLLFLPLFSIAQSNYKSGYAVNLKGDTLHGYIEYKEWGHNPRDINFKPGPDSKAIHFELTGLKYFEIRGFVSYEKYDITLSTNTVDISSPSSVADTGSVPGTVFLKILQKGKNITLYQYRDGLKERFYVKDNRVEVPVELIYGIYQDPNNSGIVINKNTYQIQLIQMVLKYSPGDDRLINRVRQSGYRETDLIQVTAQINGDTQAQASLKSSNSAAFRFFAGAAFITSSLKAGAFYGSPTATSNFPKIGLGLDAIVNPGVGHLIFRVELAYAKNNFNYAIPPDPLFNIAGAQTTYENVKQSVVFLTPQVIYNIYNADRLKVFLDLGYSVNFLSYPNNYTEEHISSKSNYSTFLLKAGFVINKRFEVYGAYSPSADISNSFEFTNNLTSYQVGLNYFLGR